MAIPPVDTSTNPIPAIVALEILESGLPVDSPLAFDLALANPALAPLPTLASLAQLNDPTREAALMQDMVAVAAADATLLQALQPAANPVPLAQLNTAANLAVVQQDLLVAADTALLPAGVPVLPVEPGTDPQALAVAAQDATILDTRQAVQAALQAGASDVSLVLSGLPQGAIALMLGAGWTPIVPDGLNGAESAASWAFHFPLRVLDVPAVASTSFAAHTGVRGKPAAPQAPLTAYGSHGQPEPAPGAAFASTMDLLD